MFKNVLLPENKLTKNTPAYSWSTIAALSKAKGLPNILKMSRNYFALASSEINPDMLVVSETRYNSTSHRLFAKAGFIDIPRVPLNLRHGKLKNLLPIRSVTMLLS